MYFVCPLAYHGLIYSIYRLSSYIIPLHKNVSKDVKIYRGIAKLFVIPKFVK